MLGKIIETCETCLYFDSGSMDHPDDGLCVRNSPQHGWPSVSISAWCGDYEKQCFQCCSCKHGRPDGCSMPFDKFYKKNPDAELDPVKSARFERVCWELGKMARRMPCKDFTRKDSSDSSEDVDGSLNAGGQNL